MSTEPTTPPDRGPGGRAWLRPVALVVSCLVIGFVAGWVLRGDEGPVTVLAPPASETAGGTGTTTTTGQAGGTPTAPATTTEEPPAPPERSEISLAVLNGTSTSGLAGQTADQAESLGYEGVTAGNAPTSTEPSVVYFRDGQRSAAERVASDLQVGQVAALPASGPLATAAPAGADVVLVLGPG